MLQELEPALVVFVLLTLVTGVAYPGVVTVVAQLLFPGQATGSVIERDGKAVGSRLLGQPFTSPQYFWGRPSATGAVALQWRGVARLQPGRRPIRRSRQRSKTASRRCAPPIRATPRRCRWTWSPRRAAASIRTSRPPRPSTRSRAWRASAGSTRTQVRRLVADATEGRTFGVLGEPRVNVLELNLALDAQADAGELHDGRAAAGSRSAAGAASRPRRRGRGAAGCGFFSALPRASARPTRCSRPRARRAPPAPISSSATSSRTAASRPSGCWKASSSCRRWRCATATSLRQEFDLDAALRAVPRSSSSTSSRIPT